MSAELHLDSDGIQMGWVFSAFLLGYALMEVPGGWMGDRWGSTPDGAKGHGIRKLQGAAHA